MVTKSADRTEVRELRIGLEQPGTGPLHRAGVAGLWMTLAEIERASAQRTLRDELLALGGSWERDSLGVTFSWNDDPAPFFERLVRASFGLTEDGRFHFLALGHPDAWPDRGTLLQEAMLATFLQHGNTRKADGSRKPSGGVVSVVDEVETVFPFRRVTAYSQQTGGQQFKPGTSKAIAGWQHPGAAVRHVAFSAGTAVIESAASALALVFAPVGAIFFRVRQRGEGVRPQFCLSVPDFDDLAIYSEAREYWLTRPAYDYIASGTADAGMRTLAILAVEDRFMASGIHRCDVVSFGTVPWSKQQKTRVDVFEVADLGADTLRLYALALQFFPPVRRQWARDANPSDGANWYWETSPVLALVAANLARHTPWWRGFQGITADRERRTQLSDHEAALRRARPNSATGVTALVGRPEAFDDSAQRQFVTACHEAWERNLGRLGQRSRERGESFRDLAGREREQLRVTFSHCKNAATFRRAITDFWSRAGGALPALQAGWHEVMPFLGEAQWEEGRDLALLALASYPGRHHETERVEDPTEGDEE
ncbi:MAG: type I-MYXAN CRISPR-associated Cas8a1/Cmx1 [Dehalococcoidia bacterium]